MKSAAGPNQCICRPRDRVISYPGPARAPGDRERMNILAVFFDFDGVIVDSEPLHWRAFSRVLEPEGLAFGWDEYRRTYIGYDDRDVFRNRLASAGRPRGAGDIEGWIRRKAEAFQTLATAERIRNNDPEIWYQAWLATAERVQKIAETADHFNFNTLFAGIEIQGRIILRNPDADFFLLHDG